MPESTGEGIKREDAPSVKRRARMEDYHLGCPRCGAEVETVSIACGRDSHRTYRCLNAQCAWSGRSDSYDSPLMVAKVRELGFDEGGECDWGFCDEPAVAMRYDPEHHRFLPVCSTHTDSAEG